MEGPAGKGELRVGVAFYCTENCYKAAHPDAELRQAVEGPLPQFAVRVAKARRVRGRA